MGNILCGPSTLEERDVELAELEHAPSPVPSDQGYRRVDSWMNKQSSRGPVCYYNSPLVTRASGADTNDQVNVNKPLPALPEGAGEAEEEVAAGPTPRPTSSVVAESEWFGRRDRNRVSVRDGADHRDRVISYLCKRDLCVLDSGVEGSGRVSLVANEHGGETARRVSLNEGRERQKEAVWKAVCEMDDLRAATGQR